MQKQTVATVPSYVEHNVNMVVLHGQRFHLVFLGHIHHFGPDPCGGSRYKDIKDNMLCIEINKKRLLFVMFTERYLYHWGSAGTSFRQKQTESFRID